MCELSNCDSETNHLMRVLRLKDHYPPFLRHFFHNGRVRVNPNPYGKKYLRASVHHVTMYLHSLATTITVFKTCCFSWGLDLGDEVQSNQLRKKYFPAPLLCWFYCRTKNHNAIHCIRVYNIMPFTDGCTVLSEWEQDAATSINVGNHHK